MPRPAFINRRPFIPDFLLKDKREGRFVTAVPALGWDQQAGFNLGVVGFLFDNGTKDDPFFRTTPYRQQISVTALGSLSGLQRYGATLDQPNMFDSPYSLGSSCSPQLRRCVIDRVAALSYTARHTLARERDRSHRARVPSYAEPRTSFA